MIRVMRATTFAMRAVTNASFVEEVESESSIVAVNRLRIVRPLHPNWELLVAESDRPKLVFSRAV